MEVNRNNPLTHIYLAAALAILGRLEEARAAARDALVLNPQLTIARTRDFFASYTNNQVNIAGRERIIEGLRKAGLPEK